MHTVNDSVKSAKGEPLKVQCMLVPKQSESAPQILGQSAIASPVSEQDQNPLSEQAPNSQSEQTEQ